MRNRNNFAAGAGRRDKQRQTANNLTGTGIEILLTLGRATGQVAQDWRCNCTKNEDGTLFTFLPSGKHLINKQGSAGSKHIQRHEYMECGHT